ncbi:DUF659 family protein [Mycena kentingensis (nom. inval.)]|nr:DUF659 family protein [Mycena kentingensis (nom. inval.)]
MSASSSSRSGLSPVWAAYERLPLFDNTGKIIAEKGKPQYKKWKNNLSNYSAWCKADLDVAVAHEVGRENAARERGEPVPFRTVEERRYAAFCGKVHDLKNHLQSCQTIQGNPSLVARRDSILMQHQAWEAKSRASSSTSHHQSVATAQSFAPHAPTRSNSFSGSAPPSPNLYALPTPHPHSQSPFLRDASIPPSPLEQFRTLPPLSRSASPAPPAKRRHVSADAYIPVSPLSPELQAEFEADLCDLFAANNWSWMGVNGDVTRFFFGKWIPGAQMPDRRHLSGKVLDERADKVIERTRKEINGKLASYSADGWKNIASTNLNSSVLSVETKPYLLKTHNMTGRPKTGDEFFKMMSSDLVLAKELYNVEIISVTTDDGPDGKKGRRLVNERMPHIVTTVCWAHQANLVAGNVLAVKNPAMAAAGECLEVVKFINNHGVTRDILRAQQIEHGERPLILFLPGATRWGSNYNSVRRVLKLRIRLQTMALAFEREIMAAAGRKEEQKFVARGVLEILQSTSFWQDLYRVGCWLEPLAIACNLLQSPDLRLDIVVLTLGNLYRLALALPAEDADVRDALLASVERRFAKADSEVMIFAVFANPCLRNRAFNRESLPPNTFLLIARRLMLRFYNIDTSGDIGFRNAIQDMLDGTGFFSDESFGIDVYITAAALGTLDPANLPDIIGMYRNMLTNRNDFTGRNGYIHLAICVLSILPNSAGPERVFSDLAGLEVPEEEEEDFDEEEGDDVNEEEEGGDDANNEISGLDMFASQSTPFFTPAPTSRLVADNVFTSSAEVLIALVEEEAAVPLPDAESAPDDDDDLPEPTLANAAQSRPLHTASQRITANVSTRKLPKFKKIKMANLFNYPTPGTKNADLEYYWNAGRVALDIDDAELEKQQAGSGEGSAMDADTGLGLSGVR